MSTIVWAYSDITIIHLGVMLLGFGFAYLQLTMSVLRFIITMAMSVLIYQVGMTGYLYCVGWAGFIMFLFTKQGALSAITGGVIGQCSKDR